MCFLQKIGDCLGDVERSGDVLGGDLARLALPIPGVDVPAVVTANRAAAIGALDVVGS